MDNWFTSSRLASKCIFCLIVVYVVAALITLAIAFGFAPGNELAYPTNLYVMIGFSLVSFCVTVFISAFHLITLIRRRKRREDKIRDSMDFGESETDAL